MSKDMPKIGLGTWEVTGADVKPVISAALQAGYKHIDTAQIYNNEYQIGLALKELNANVDELFITSKVWMYNFKHHTTKSLKESLRRLGLKKIDLMLLHVSFNKESNVIAFKELLEARKQGLIDHVGVSNFTVAQLEEIKNATGQYPYCNQIIVAPTVRLREIETFCKNKGIKLVGYSTLRSYFNPNPWYDDSGMNEQQKAYVDTLATKYKKNVGQILSKWALQNGYHIIPKSRQPERVISNFQLEGFELTKQEMEELDSWNTYSEKRLKDVFYGNLNALGTKEEIDKHVREGLLFDKNFHG